MTLTVRIHGSGGAWFVHFANKRLRYVDGFDPMNGDRSSPS
jgi:hypothetical protein